MGLEMPEKSGGIAGGGRVTDRARPATQQVARRISPRAPDGARPSQALQLPGVDARLSLVFASDSDELVDADGEQYNAILPPLRCRVCHIPGGAIPVRLYPCPAPPRNFHPSVRTAGPVQEGWGPAWAAHS